MGKSRFRIHSKRIKQWIYAVGSGMIADAIGVCITEFLQPDSTRIDPWSDIQLQILFTIFALLTLTLVALLIYNYMYNVLNEDYAPPQSILRGKAAEQEKQIIALLKSVARPAPGRNRLNRAATAQFMRALCELGYIDPQLTATHILPWVESVTGYTDGEKGHFQAAYKKTTRQDTKVQEYMRQVEQL